LDDLLRSFPFAVAAAAAFVARWVPGAGEDGTDRLSGRCVCVAAKAAALA